MITAISQWLLHAAIAGSILLALATLLIRWRKEQTRLQIRIIEMAFVGCLVIPILSQLPGIPRWFTGVIESTNVNATIAELPNQPGERFVRSMANTPRQPVGKLTEEPPNETTTNQRMEQQPAVATDATSEKADDAMPTVAAKSISSALSWELGLVGVWGMVVSILAARWLRGWWRLRKLIRCATPANESMNRYCRELAGSHRQSVRIFVSSEIPHPIAFGYFRPIILIPAQTRNEELRFALSHEWSHLLHGDLGRWYLATLVQFLFFWNPLYWKLREQLRFNQDLIADAFAVQQGEAEDYADYLVSVAKQSHPLTMAIALGLGDRPSQLYRRVIMLIHGNVNHLRKNSRWWSLGVLGFVVCWIGILSIVRLEADEKTKLESKPAESKANTEQKESKDQKEIPVWMKPEKLTYSGIVKSKLDGKPIPNAIVTVRRMLTGSVKYNEPEEIMEESKHTTDQNGKYQFTIPPEQSGKWSMYIELDVEAPGFAPQAGFGYALSMLRKNELAGERPFFESVELRPAKQISGSVEKPDGTPAEGVRVLSYSNRGRGEGNDFEYGSFADVLTDKDGKFSLWIITPGDGVFWILPKSFAPSLHVLKKDQRGDLGKFILQSGIVIKGKVIDTDGKPVKKIPVEIDRQDREDALSELIVADHIGRVSITNEEGEFEFQPLPPGNYSVKPIDRFYDRTERSNRRDNRKFEFDQVFMPLKVKLVEGEKPQPIEVRAVPYVVIEGQYLNSKGEPSGGHEPWISGQMDNQTWHTHAKVIKGGKIIAKVPHGLEGLQMHLVDNEHNSLRWRLAPDQPLKRERYMQIGTADRDIKTIQIFRYEAPTLIVDIKGKNGEKIDSKDLHLIGTYPPPEEGATGIGYMIGGRISDLSFEKQNNNRFRSSQLLPDEEITITAFKEGYRDTTLKLKLKEKETKEIEIILEKKD